MEIFDYIGSRLSDEYETSYLHNSIVYKDAFTLCLAIFEREWPNIQKLKDKQQLLYCDALIHTSNTKPPKYKEFERVLPDIPTFFRNAVVKNSLEVLTNYYKVANQNNEEEPDNRKILKAEVKDSKFPVNLKDDNRTNKYNPYVLQIEFLCNSYWKWVNMELDRTFVDKIRSVYHSQKIPDPMVCKVNDEWIILVKYKR